MNLRRMAAAIYRSTFWAIMWPLTDRLQELEAAEIDRHDEIDERLCQIEALLARVLRSGPQ